MRKQIFLLYIKQVCTLFPWRRLIILLPIFSLVPLGHCKVEWAYIITILGGVLSLLSTLLPCAMPIQVPFDLEPSCGKRYLGEYPKGSLYVSKANMPLLLAKNTTTPTDQSSINQGSFSRKTSSVQGPMIAMSSSSYTPTTEYRVLMPATPVIVQTSWQVSVYHALHL